EREQKVKEGRKEAQEIINKADKQSEAARKEKLAKTQREVEKIIVEARGQIREERDLMVRDVKKELSGIIGLALNKVTSEVIDDKDHLRLIDDTIEKIDDNAKKAKLKK
ncbi:hypothetical protein HZA75_03295, partial [Candidatus Roizmanbacteria bacterium]|nr:hypothetical protein [Candidatus Roizmanbacteria bacterium]